MQPRIRFTFNYLMHLSPKEETCTGTFNVNGRETTNFNSLVFRTESIWKAIYNAEIRIKHFCQDIFQVLKSLY